MPFFRSAVDGKTKQTNNASFFQQNQPTNKMNNFQG